MLQAGKTSIPRGSPSTSAPHARCSRWHSPYSYRTWPGSSHRECAHADQRARPQAAQVPLASWSQNQHFIEALLSGDTALEKVAAPKERIPARSPFYCIRLGQVKRWRFGAPSRRMPRGIPRHTLLPRHIKNRSSVCRRFGGTTRVRSRSICPVPNSDNSWFGSTANERAHSGNVALVSGPSLTPSAQTAH